MSIFESIKEEVMTLNEQYMANADDSYNFWEEHIKYVVQESLKLSKTYGADIEIVELAALLHDIALMAKVGVRSEHHVNSANLAKNLLAKYKYPEEKSNKVIKCILNHRSSKNGTSVEELCVADADILAHFDNILMVISNVIGNSSSLQETRDKLRDAFEYDYNDLSDMTKKVFNKKYQIICHMVLG